MQRGHRKAETTELTQIQQPRLLRINCSSARSSSSSLGSWLKGNVVLLRRTSQAVLGAEPSTFQAGMQEEPSLSLWQAMSWVRLLITSTSEARQPAGSAPLLSESQSQGRGHLPAGRMLAEPVQRDASPRAVTFRGHQCPRTHLFHLTWRQGCLVAHSTHSVLSLRI